MNQFRNAFVNFITEEEGPTAVEYAVMLALIIVICLTAISFLGQVTNKTFSNVASAIQSTGS
jgi:pilus assembly protein Flp/PilA